jgi:hypothetical protein
MLGGNPVRHRALALLVALHLDPMDARTKRSTKDIQTIHGIITRNVDPIAIVRKRKIISKIDIPLE